MEVVAPLILALLAGVVLAQGAIWYKLGKVESKVDAHLQHHIRGVLTDDGGHT